MKRQWQQPRALLQGEWVVAGPQATLPCPALSIPEEALAIRNKDGCQFTVNTPRRLLNTYYKVQHQSTTKATGRKSHSENTAREKVWGIYLEI